MQDAPKFGVPFDTAKRGNFLTIPFGVRGALRYTFAHSLTSLGATFYKMFYNFSQTARGFVPAKNGKFVLINGQYIARTCATNTHSTLPSAGEHLPKQLIAKGAPKGSIYHTGYFGPNGTPPQTQTKTDIGPAFAAAIAAAKSAKNQDRAAKREEKAAKSAAYWARVESNKAARDAAKAQKAKERAAIAERREQEKAAAAAALAVAVATAPKPLTPSNRRFQQAEFLALKLERAKQYAF